MPEGNFLGLELYQWMVVALVLLGASMIQSAAGFGAGLFATPLLQWLGLQLPEIISVNVALSFVQSGWGYFRLRRHLQFKSAVRPILIRILAIPIGAAALYFMNESLGAGSQVYIKPLVGLVILGIVVLQLSFRVEPRETLPAIWEWIAFGASGFLVGSFGMGGPPAVLWVQAHLWEPLKSRAYLFLIMVSSVPFHITLLYFLFPDEVVRGATIGLLGLPFVFAGVFVGMFVGKRFTRASLRVVVYVLLIAIALYAIGAGVAAVWTANDAVAKMSFSILESFQNEPCFMQ